MKCRSAAIYIFHSIDFLSFACIAKCVTNRRSDNFEEEINAADDRRENVRIMNICGSTWSCLVVSIDLLCIYSLFLFLSNTFM